MLPPKQWLRHVQGVSPPCLGRQPPMLYPRAKARLSIGLVGVHLKLIAMLSRDLISDNNRQACLPTSSLSYVFKIKWFKVRAPNHIFPSVILQYRGKRTEFRLTFQNVFMFLRNGARKVFPSIRRCFQQNNMLEAHSAP